MIFFVRKVKDYLFNDIDSILGKVKYKMDKVTHLLQLHYYRVMQRKASMVHLSVV